MRPARDNVIKIISDSQFIFIIIFYKDCFLIIFFFHPFSHSLFDHDQNKGTRKRKENLNKVQIFNSIRLNLIHKFNKWKWKRKKSHLFTRINNIGIIVICREITLRISSIHDFKSWYMVCWNFFACDEMNSIIKITRNWDWRKLIKNCNEVKMKSENSNNFTPTVIFIIQVLR